MILVNGKLFLMRDRGGPDLALREPGPFLGAELVRCDRIGPCEPWRGPLGSGTGPDRIP